jgi:excisionase family DNA binding protein
MQVQNQQKATPLLSRREAAEFLGIRESTLAVWHATNRYPLPVIKVGRLARYRRDDLEHFLDQRTTPHTAPQSKEG